ncbi:NERD domain-containing protein [Streptomyces sp. NPDC052535]|uniref:nuclease-related domain-containing protein n=1 Tax=Streptomyces sp. NPDC052535 TaxID=3155531 RepID=UPI003448F9DD
MSAGRSADERADAVLRAARPTGLLARLKAALGFPAAIPAEAMTLARNSRAGAEGERRTAALVRPLADEGWFGLFDRSIPGMHSANVDIFLVAPSGDVIPVDAKLWHRNDEVLPVNGRLFHGEKDYGSVIGSVRLETTRMRESLREALRRRGHTRPVAVTPLIAMHNAPVAGGGFILDGVRIVPADDLVAVLRTMAGRPDPWWAETVAAVASTVLPRYEEEEGDRR